MNIKTISMRVICAAVAAATFFSAFPAYALDASAENEITLTADTNEKLTIAQGESATLDLAGFTLTSDSAESCVIENNGSLVIKDSSADKTGQIKKHYAGSDLSGIINNGSLTIEGGTVSAVSDSDYLAYGIDNRGTLTVSGGEISADTSGTKWAVGVYNTGVVEQVSGGKISGTIDNSANGNNALGISNEQSGKIKSVSGGTIEAFTNTSGVAYAIRNRGEAESISGGYMHGYSNGSGWTFAFYNTDTGTVNSISGGKFYGEFANPSSGNNGLGISNEGVISSISGGLFTASVLGSGSAYGIRSDKEISEISGGAFGGSSSANTIYKRGGTITYKSGSTLASYTAGGMRYFLNKSDYYVELCDERTDFAGAYVFDSEGKLAAAYELNPDEKYTVYIKSGGKNKTAEYSLDDFSAVGSNTTLYTQTDNSDAPVMYFLGSSVTYGHATGGVSFVEYLENDNDWICEKRAVSGTTLVLGTNSYISRMKSQIGKNAKIDCFTCQLSTNDATQNKTLGTVSSSYNLDDFKTTTIIGAMEYIICYAYENWNCPVVFYTNPKYTSAAYVKMIDALYKLQEKWGVEIIDFYYYKNMSALSSTELSAYMSDSIHPNSRGYQWMSDVMTGFYKDILAKEPQAADFTELNETISQAEAIDVSLYTADSVKTFTEALEKAKSVAQNDNAMQIFITNAAKVLREAIDGLTRLPGGEEEIPGDPTICPPPNNGGTTNPQNGTQVVDGKTVLYKDGKAVTGTQAVTVAGKTYAVVGGYVKTGKVQFVKIGSKSYIVNKQGIVQKGTKNRLVKIGSKSYIVNKSGVLIKPSKNKLVNTGVKTYIVNKKGIVVKGKKNKLVKVGKKSYVVSKSGLVQKNKKKIKVGKKIYKTNKKGVAALKKK